MKRIIFTFLVSLTLAACVPLWTHLERPTPIKDQSYSVELPGDWVRQNQAPKGNIVITHDGTNIQAIRVEQTPHDKAFPNLKKKSSSAMLPSELAELQIAELKSIPGLANIEVVENIPVSVSGSPGYKLHLSFRNLKGLRFELLWIGVTNNKNYYSLTYQAPSIHYFPKYKPEFEKVVESFRLI
jgi:PsbP